MINFEAHDREKGYIFDVIIDLEILVANDCYSPSFSANYKSLF